MTEKTVLMAIDPIQYGLDEQKATQIKEQFMPMLNKMEELQNEFNEIIKLDITPEVCDKAKSLRLKYVKVRTGTAEIHKRQKAFYLAAGRFIDGWKNTQLFASEGIESKLKSIEEYFEIQEKEKKESLNKERAEKVKPFGIDTSQINFGEMNEEVWNAFFTGAETNYNAKIAAEAAAEEKRLNDEKKQKQFNDRKFELQKYSMLATAEDQITIDSTEDEYNEVLNRLESRHKNIQLQREMEAERIRLVKPYIAYIDSMDELFKLSDPDFLEKYNELKRMAEKDAEEKRIKDQNDKLQEERYQSIKHLISYCSDIDLMKLYEHSSEAWQIILNSKTEAFAEDERIKKEKAQKEAEEKAAAEKAAADELRKQQAPDKEKLIELRINLEMYKLPEVESDFAKLIVNDVRKLLDKVADHIKTKLESK